MEACEKKETLKMCSKSIPVTQCAVLHAHIETANEIQGTCNVCGVRVFQDKNGHVVFLLIKLAGLFWPRILPGVIYTWNELHRHLQLQQSIVGNPDGAFQSSTPKRTSCALKHRLSSRKQRQQLAQTDGGYPVAGSHSRRLSTPH